MNQHSLLNFYLVQSPFVPKQRRLVIPVPCTIGNKFSPNERRLYAAAYFIVYPHSSSIPLDSSASHGFDDCCEGCLSEGLDESETRVDPAGSTAGHRSETKDSDVELTTGTTGSNGSIALMSSGDESLEVSIPDTTLQKQTTAPTDADRPSTSDLHRLLNPSRDLALLQWRDLLIRQTPMKIL
ncbi:hypothetical protein BDZ89DRAFT_146244 [Hymenopellis radicata]|nr:hypothetical protein BDZ89DRAFT_146244 [Hymenopellis radicata]